MVNFTDFKEWISYGIGMIRRTLNFRMNRGAGGKKNSETKHYATKNGGQFL